MQGPGGHPLAPHRDPSRITLLSVWTQSGSLATENIGRLVVIALVLVAIPAVATRLATLLSFSALAQSPVPVEWHLSIVLVISLTLNFLLPSFVLVGAIGEQIDEAMAGKPIRILRALRHAVFHLPAMVFSAMAIGLTIALSLPLLLMPAFALVPAMLLAPAASVMRKQGLRLGMEEAAMLAKGRRGSILFAAAAWIGAVTMLGQMSEYLLNAAIVVGAKPSLALFLVPTLLLLSLQAIAGACVSIVLYTETRKVVDYQQTLNRISEAM